MTPPPSPAPAPRPAGSDDPARARAGRLLLWQAAALMGMVLTLMLALPWKLGALPLALAALVLGVLTWTAARRAPRTGAARASASVGIALALVGGLTAALPLLAYEQTQRFEDCTASALTDRARQACTDRFREDVQPAGALSGPTG